MASWNNACCGMWLHAVMLHTPAASNALQRWRAVCHMFANITYIHCQSLRITLRMSMYNVLHSWHSFPYIELFVEIQLAYMEMNVTLTVHVVWPQLRAMHALQRCHTARVMAHSITLNSWHVRVPSTEAPPSNNGHALQQLLDQRVIFGVSWNNNLPTLRKHYLCIACFACCYLGKKLSRCWWKQSE